MPISVDSPLSAMMAPKRTVAFPPRPTRFETGDFGPKTACQLSG